jgi:hypothetical protein
VCSSDLLWGFKAKSNDDVLTSVGKVQPVYFTVGGELRVSPVIGGIWKRCWIRLHKMVRISLERFLCANVYASGEVTTVCGATTVKSTFFVVVKSNWGVGWRRRREARPAKGRQPGQQQFHFNLETALVTGNLSHSPNTVVYQLRRKSWQFL